MTNHVLHDLNGAGLCRLQLEELFDQKPAWRLLLNLKGTLGEHQGQLQSTHFQSQSFRAWVSTCHQFGIL